MVTRCFGWGLPCTTMVPFADFINHHNVDSSYELISKCYNPREENKPEENAEEKDKAEPFVIDD